MKIGVISDTHLSSPSKKLSELAQGAFKDVSFLLHAGDITSMQVLDAFFGLEVIAVSGNMDDYGVTSALPAKRVAEIDGFRIGMIHGWGGKRGLEERVRKSFGNVDAIVYGHSHIPVNHVKNGILIFNPGSFMGSYFKKKDASVGILTTDESIRGEIIKI